MSAASHPTHHFLFVDGIDSAHYERTVRSYISRKVWRERRVEQIRKYQNTPSTSQLTLGRSYQRSKISNAEPLEVDIEAERPLKGGRQPRQHDSLLTATERELINVDPFHTLPCRLDRSGQDLAHRAKNLFLQFVPPWSSTAYTATTGLRIGYMYRVSFCSMLALASYYLDFFSGRGPSPETLQWNSAAVSCTRCILSNPVTQGGDEALLSVLLLLANDQLMQGGESSSLHSKALARLFGLRGGIESLRLPHTMELFIIFNLIVFCRAQTAHLDHMRSDAEGAAEFQEWKADVDLLVLELQNLNTWDRATHLEGRAERRAILIKVVSFLPRPKDMIEQHYWAFVLCYLAVMLWEYRYRPRDGDNLLREFARQCALSTPKSKLAEVAWLLIRGLDRDQTRKWQINRMIKVLHRLSDGLRLKIGRFLYRLVDPRQARDVFLDAKDFESIQQEALAGLPVTDSTTCR